MSTIFYLSALGFGIFPFFFLFWRRLKEDYASALIFTTAFQITLLVLFVTFPTLLASGYVPETSLFSPRGLWFWAGSLSALCAAVFIVRKNKLKLIETLEAGIVAALPLLAFVYMADALAHSSPSSLVFAIVTVLLFAAYFVLDRKYKGFSWYKSGRVGFSGLAVAMLFFLFRTFYSLYNPNAFSLIGRVDLVASAVAAFLLVFTLYNLSES